MKCLPPNEKVKPGRFAIFESDDQIFTEQNVSELRMDAINDDLNELLHIQIFFTNPFKSIV